jgi:arginine decarboxylase
MSTIYLSSGSGTAPSPYTLLAFDRALQDGGIADLNHLRVSSIIPPETRIIENKPPKYKFPYGALAKTVYSEAYGKEGETISACLVLIQTNHENGNRGVIFEASGIEMEEVIQKKTLFMAMEAMKDRGFPIDVITTVSKTLKVPPGSVGCVIAAAIMDI